MLISFKVSNFLSVSKVACFSMIPSLKDEDNLLKIKKVNLLKMGVIFGANSSGKSNLIKAISFGSELVQGRINKKSKNFYSKISEFYKYEDSLFEYNFYIDNEFYSYGFYINLVNQTISSEYLYKIIDTNEEMIFERTNNELILNLDLEINELSLVNNFFKKIKSENNALFLNKINQVVIKNNKLDIFEKVYSWFSDNLVINYQANDSNIYEYTFNEEKQKFIKILKLYDLGISDVSLTEVNFNHLISELSQDNKDLLESEIRKRSEKGKTFSFGVSLDKSLYNIIGNDANLLIYKVYLVHDNMEVNFDFSEESDGTRKIFSLIDILMKPVDGKVYLFDELGLSIHPLVTAKFIDSFKRQLNNKSLQLIFTTHESSLLTNCNFRKDEIWFVEKNRDNSSLIYSLDIFEKLENKDLSSNYLSGFYGAVPIIKDED